MALRRYTETDNGVMVHFDGLNYPVKAQLLVGCDGAFSAVRQQALDDGLPVFDVRACVHDMAH